MAAFSFCTTFSTTCTERVHYFYRMDKNSGAVSHWAAFEWNKDATGDYCSLHLENEDSYLGNCIAVCAHRAVSSTMGSLIFYVMEGATLLPLATYVKDQVDYSDDYIESYM